jgi:DNA polymerase-3 subunit alpha
MACLLTSVKTNLDKAAIYLADARSMGIKVLTPDVNRSLMDFAPLPQHSWPEGLEMPVGAPGVVTFGLSAVRNVGEALVELLVSEREENGPFSSFHDFAERVPEGVLNKRTVESLIKAGAFDSLGHPRRGLLAAFEQIIDTTVARRRERDQGVMSLFGDWGDGETATTGGGFDDRIEIPEMEFDKTERLKFEKEMLGLYVSDHPLMGVEAALRRRTDCTINEAVEKEDGAQLTIGGVINGLARKFTKKGDQMAVFILEDLQASIEVTVFPRTLVEQGHKLADDAIVTLKGRLDRRDERVGFMCQDVAIVEGLEASVSMPLHLKIPASMLDENRIDLLKRIVRENPGESRIILHLGQGKVLRLADDFAVDIDRAVGELRVAFGHNAVML